MDNGYGKTSSGDNGYGKKSLILVGVFMVMARTVLMILVMLLLVMD